MVRRAGFWRTVAFKAAAATDYDYPMDWDAEQVVAAIAAEVLAADGLNATPAGETMQAEVDDGD
jgi:hypothetical protein